MRNKKSVAVIISIMLISMMEMISCTHSPQVHRVSFSTDIIPIFTASCAINTSCHLGANSTNQDVALDSAEAYNSIFAKRLVSVSNPSSSLLYAEVAEGQMPLYPYPLLSVSQQQLILDWIKQGALND